MEPIEMFIVDRIMAKGDAVRLISPGGAGFGPPVERPSAEVARSLRDGFTSREYAARHYPGAAPRDGS
ncbi:MAG: hypothetical protein E5Y35_02700 [Mesorhizobium sp.]|nr:MAG: hypothetical protein E5Y35_02700 [Mesorhizobium sp.]